MAETHQERAGLMGGGCPLSPRSLGPRGEAAPGGGWDQHALV